MDRDLSKHRHVLDFRLSQVRAIRGDEDQFGLSLSYGLHGMLVSQDSFSRLHDQLQTAVHVILLLFLYFKIRERD